MEKRFWALLLSLALAFTLWPGTALATEGEMVTLACNISGAEIYVDDSFANMVTDADAPTTVRCASAQRVTVRLPGYTAAYTYGDGAVSAVLTPELYPASYEDKITTLTVDDVDLTLEGAVAQAMSDESDTWYVIEFAQGITGILVSDPININARGKITVNGLRPDGGRVQVAKRSDYSSWLGVFNIIASDVRLMGLKFEKSTIDRDSCYYSMRVFDDETRAFDVENVYVLDCVFNNTGSVGIGTCGEYGYGAVGYDQPGTADFSNINFCANSFTNTGIFNFAGAGDEDYNVIEDYNICANSLDNGGIGFITGDAHSWYVHGHKDDGIGFCNNNIIQNVLISGNTIHDSGIGVQTANLGNHDNLLQNVTIRNNTVLNATKQSTSNNDKDPHRFNQALGIINVVVADNYSETGSSMDLYKPYMTPGLTHTDNNILRDIYVYDNYFECGYARELQVFNVKVDVGEQCGSHNTMSNIQLYRNTIVSENGVRICNYAGSTDSGCCTDNTMSGVTFSGNTLTRTGRQYYDVGVLAAASYLSQHGHPLDEYPEYRGTMTDIKILDNTVDGFTYGIMAAGAGADYGLGQTLSDVEISRNTVTARNWMAGSIVDFGVVVAGAAMPTNGEHLGSRDCLVKNVTVTDNIITARTGAAVSGFLACEGITYPWTGNRAENVSLSGNTMTQRPLCEGDNQRTAGIIAADLIEVCYKLGYTEKDRTDMVAGNRVSGVVVGDNTLSGFDTDKALYGGSFHSQASGLDGEWTWIKQTPADGGGIPLSRAVDGQYAAKRPVNDLWVYQTYTVDKDCFAFDGRLESGGFALDWSAKGAFNCCTALYNADGQMLALRDAAVAAEEAASTLHFAFPDDQIAATQTGKMFFLDTGYAPQREAYAIAP